jgi:predicted phage terminase large subunit-like protein
VIRDVEIELPVRHAGQNEVAAGARRFNVVACGRRWGKTVLGVDLLSEAAIEGRRVAWFAPTYKMLLEPWRLLRRYLSPLASSINASEHRIELVTGGIVDAWSLDNPDAPRGRKYHDAVIDEAAMVRELMHVWNAVIRPTLTDYQGNAWFLSTPRGFNGFQELFERNSPEWASFQMPTTTNPHIDPAEIEAARLEVPELVFRQEYLAEFVDLAGSVVRREWLKSGEPAGQVRTVMAVDLAISTKASADFTAAVVLSIDGDGRIYVRHAERVQAPFHQVLQFIQKIAERFRPQVVAIEQVQFQAAVVQELLRTTTLPVKGVRPDGDKLVRFQPLVARYEQGLVYHSPSLPNEFERELLAFPHGGHDDMVDALAYAYASIAAKRNTIGFA